MGLRAIVSAWKDLIPSAPGALFSLPLSPALHQQHSQDHNNAAISMHMAYLQLCGLCDDCQGLPCSSAACSEQDVSLTILPAMVGALQDLCAAAAICNSCCMVLAHLHAMLACEDSLSAAAIACMAKERHFNMLPLQRCMSAYSKLAWWRSGKSNSLCAHAYISFLSFQRSCGMLTLWNARSLPSSACVITHGMSRYEPLR